MKRDYYEVLGIDKKADKAAVKKAYRKLAKRYHPDTNAGNAQAEERFKEVNEAYDILGDDEKRKLYDEFGHAAFNEGFDPDLARQAAAGGFSGAGFGGRDFHQGGNFREFHFEGGSMDDLFGDIFGDAFGRAEGAYGGQGFGGRSSYRMKGEDIESEIRVSFDDAVFGCDKVITLRSGTGSSQPLKVHIPAGIDDGKKIRLKGKGHPGYGGGEPGDLFLKLKITPKPGFERKETDVYTTVSIPFTTAVLGGKIRVHTLYGDVECSVKEGTQSGSKIRLKNKGIVSMNHPSQRGDHYVVIQIQVPRNLSPEAKQRLKEFERSCDGQAGA